MTAERFRLKFMFWLDVTKPADLVLAEEIEAIKAQRRFTQTIRDGIRLIGDLRAGRLDILFELFPWTGAAFLTAVTQPASVSAAPNNDELKREIASLRDLILRTNIPTGGAGPVHSPRSLIPVSKSPKLLSVPQFDLPSFDDDDGDTLSVHRDTNTDSAQNFLNSMLRLQQ